VCALTKKNPPTQTFGGGAKHGQAWTDIGGAGRMGG